MLIRILSGLAEFGSIKGGGIAWVAYIGGFVSGLLLIILMRKNAPEGINHYVGVPNEAYQCDFSPLLLLSSVSLLLFIAISGGD
jgi:hypothetical protein